MRKIRVDGRKVGGGFAQRGEDGERVGVCRFDPQLHDISQGMSGVGNIHCRFKSSMALYGDHNEGCAGVCCWVSGVSVTLLALPASFALLFLSPSVLSSWGYCQQCVVVWSGCCCWVFVGRRGCCEINGILFSTMRSVLALLWGVSTE